MCYTKQTMTIFWIIYFFIAGALSSAVASDMSDLAKEKGEDIPNSKIARFIISSLFSLAWPLFFAYALLFGPIGIAYMNNDSAANKEKDENNS